MTIVTRLCLALLVVLPACSKSNEVSINNGEDAGNDDHVLPECAAGTSPGKHGPEMLPVGRLDGSCFWVDKTEVTTTDYAAFVAEVATLGDQANVAECKGQNTSFEPEGGLPAASQLPMTAVDWCDAAAFCAWAGKRLCGTYKASTEFSEWETTCTDGDHAGFDYGALARSDTCNGGSSSELDAVGSNTGCVTPTLVLDMVGNAREWTAECAGSGATSECTLRGGGYTSTGTDWGCKSKRTLLRNKTMPDLGIRCCAEK